jgi:UDP-N-acetyl-D-galactosamine dehydrogenase
VHDPWVAADDAEREYGLRPVEALEQGAYDAIVVAVGHQKFADMGVVGIRALGKPISVIYDVKCLLPRESVDGRL